MTDTISKFCISCGQELPDRAGWCPACGKALSTNGGSGSPGPSHQGIRAGAAQVPDLKRGRNKTATHLLAAFLGWWSWLYLYQWNKRKIWIGVGVCGGELLGLILWIVGLAAVGSSYYGSPGGAAIGTFGIIIFWLGVAAAFGLRIWAVVDASQVSDAAYASYPERA